jgi:hypothetical protein
MPLTLPALDDRAFADLVAEALTRIPALAPDWTNFNASDPGITLIELFAWLTDVLIYRVNRVTDANTIAFLKLLNGPGWKPSADLNADIRQTVLTLRRCDRAVVAADFEALAAEANPAVARARCVPRRNLAAAGDADAPGHVSVIVLAAGGVVPQPALLAAVAKFLEPRRLLTTRVHVVPPVFVPIGVSVTLTLTADAVDSTVRSKAAAALAGWLHPLTGGADGTGWPFGRAVYVSEVIRLLGTVAGVDHVDATGTQPELVTTDQTRLRRNTEGALTCLWLAPAELPQAVIAPAALTLVKAPRS